MPLKTVYYIDLKNTSLLKSGRQAGI